MMSIARLVFPCLIILSCFNSILLADEWAGVEGVAYSDLSDERRTEVTISSFDLLSEAGKSASFRDSLTALHIGGERFINPPGCLVEFMIEDIQPIRLGSDVFDRIMKTAKRYESRKSHYEMLFNQELLLFKVRVISDFSDPQNWRAGETFELLSPTGNRYHYYKTCGQQTQALFTGMHVFGKIQLSDIDFDFPLLDKYVFTSLGIPGKSEYREEYIESVRSLCNRAVQAKMGGDRD
ncbi:MAG: hypothetical protein GY832_09160 [Chloroflexi bacterium]|nr:hypothetical protein [Chloroflexota bacterium]